MKNKLNYEDEIIKKAQKQDDLIIKRANNADGVLDKLFEDFRFNMRVLDKLVNPNNQNEWTTLFEFYDKNPKVPREIIFRELVNEGYITLYQENEDEDSVIMLLRNPYIDKYMKANITIKSSSDLDDFEYEIKPDFALVISDKLEKILQKFCDNYCKENADTANE